MELYIMDKNFVKQDVVETFYSLIWTERYYGDSEVELVVPLTSSLIQKLTQKQSTFLGIDKSWEPMIIETSGIEEGKLKVKGISILSWLNNRFIRASPNHKAKVWVIKNKKAGDILWTIVRNMCTNQILNMSMGLTTAQKQELIIPNLSLDNFDTSGKTIKSIKVAYGPVYDELKRIAEVYKIGMQITLDPITRTLKYRNYKGINRTSEGVNQALPVIRFSIDMQSFSDVKELRSTAELKTLVYAFASGVDDTALHPDTPGADRRSETPYTGFDLRAKMILVSDISNDDLTGATTAAKKADCKDTLDTDAEKELRKNKYIQTVDGEVSPMNQFKYGEGNHYNLGDQIEVQGPTGAIEISRVTEYIRTQDENGEREYPTVEAVEP